MSNKGTDALNVSARGAFSGGLAGAKERWTRASLHDKGELFYTLALFVYIWYEMIKLSMILYCIPGFIINILRFGSLLLLGLSEITELKSGAKLSGKTYFEHIREMVACNKNAHIYAMALLLASFVSFLLSDVFVPVYSALFIISARHYDFSCIAHTALCSIVSCSAVIVVACLFGITEDHIWIQSGGERIRHGLGFRYATYASFFLLYATLILLYIKKGKLGCWITAGIALIDVLIFLLTNSRTAFLLTLLAIIIGWATTSERRAVGRIVKGLAIAAPYIFLAVVVASIILMAIFDPSNEFLSRVNSVLGDRLSISHLTYSQNGMSLFGQYVEMHGQGLMEDGTRYTAGPVSFIDNSFCHIAVRNGLLLLVLLGSAEFVLLRRLAQKGRELDCALLMIVTIHAFIDSWYLWICMNIFLLLIGTELLKPNGSRTLEERCSHVEH